ncbi:hypothetical protein, partial [Pantoea ananatis]|uniref:hypothetical protein n=1 Tax=Pantoea ananas TaxID=553 RepID=UPI001B30B533
FRENPRLLLISNRSFNDRIANVMWSLTRWDPDRKLSSSPKAFCDNCLIYQSPLVDAMKLDCQFILCENDCSNVFILCSL